MRKILICLILCFMFPTSVNADMNSVIEANHIAVEAMHEVWDFERGYITDTATQELLDVAVEKMENVIVLSIKSDLELMRKEAQALLDEKKAKEEEERRKKEAEERMASARYYGNCRITFYTHTGCNTASGVYPTANHTAANNTLPFGTKIMVDGQVYIIEDRGDSGMGETGIDIFCDTEYECNQRGLYWTDVYIVD